MTAGRTRLIARLVAAFDEADQIETRPIVEIRKALRDQGVDPTASIKLAQGLARSKADRPVASLLGKIERSEAVDAEIAALETASIDEVRASLPADMTASATAVAKRRSAQLLKPSEIWRRRLSPLGFGGSLIGIAASVILFIALRPDQLRQAEAPHAPIESALPADAMDVEADDILLQAEKRLQPLAKEERAGQSAPPQESLSSAGEPLDRARSEKDALASLENSLRVQNPEEDADAALPVAPEIAGLLPARHELTGVVLADPAEISVELEVLADLLPDRKLAVKLDEARVQASGREVVALIAFMREGERVEAALVETLVSRPLSDLSTPSAGGVSAFTGEKAVVLAGPKRPFELLELPSDR